MPDVTPDVLRILQRAGRQLTLVDVGASGDPPQAWLPLAGISHYIGFDPDLREMRDEHDRVFSRATILADAVTADPDATSTTFYLTSSPYCSSSLHPDTESLASWLFRDLFDVVDTAVVPATTLDRALDQLGVGAVDWLKIDSQGTDLRIVESLRDERFDHLLAVDIEPGLIDAYRGEDLFIDVHRSLTSRGFWLSHLNVDGAVRAAPDTTALLQRADPAAFADLRQRVRPSPGWCEARYLRTPATLDWTSSGDPAALWALTMLDGQVTAAIDVALAWRAAGGPAGIIDDMVASALAALQVPRRQRVLRSVLRATPGPVKGAVRRLLAS